VWLILLKKEVDNPVHLVEEEPVEEPEVAEAEAVVQAKRIRREISRTEEEVPLAEEVKEEEEEVGLAEEADLTEVEVKVPL